MVVAILAGMGRGIAGGVSAAGRGMASAGRGIATGIGNGAKNLGRIFQRSPTSVKAGAAGAGAGTIATAAIAKPVPRPAPQQVKNAGAAPSNSNIANYFINPQTPGEAISGKGILDKLNTALGISQKPSKNLTDTNNEPKAPAQPAPKVEVKEEGASKAITGLSDTLKGAAKGSAQAAASVGTTGFNKVKSLFNWGKENTLAMMGSDSFHALTFFAISVIVWLMNIGLIFVGSSFMHKTLFVTVLTLFGWWLLYDANGIESFFFCLILSILTVIQPLLAAFLPGDFLKMAVTFAPIWPVAILFFAHKRSKFLNFLAITYIIVWCVVLFPSVSNAASKMFGSEELPFPDYAEIASKESSIAVIARNAFKEVKETPERLIAAFNAQMYYAQHGYYPGEQEKDVKFVGIKLVDPEIANKLEYDPDRLASTGTAGTEDQGFVQTGVSGTRPGSQSGIQSGAESGASPTSEEVVEISARLKANNKKPMSIIISCNSIYEECDADTACGTQSQTIMPNEISSVRNANKLVVCQPRFSEKGRHKVVIAATAKNFKTSAALSENFVSENSLNEKLDQYIESHDVIGEYERPSILSQMYKVSETPVSISEAGMVKLILATLNEPVVGISDKTKIPLVVALERTDTEGGNIEKVNELSIALPKGLAILTSTETTKGYGGKGIVDPDAPPDLFPQDALFKYCPAFEYLTGSDTIIQLRKEYKTKGYINFTQAEQQQYPKCWLRVANPAELLKTPERPNLATFRANIDFDYKIEKEYSVKWGTKPPRTATSSSSAVSGGEACPAVDNLQGHAVKDDAKVRSMESVLSRYDSEIRSAASKYSNVCTALIKGIITVECGTVSEFPCSTPNSAGAVGPMQVLEIGRGGAGDGCKQRNIVSNNADLKNIQKNIECGTSFMSGLLNTYNGDIEKSLGFYNGGVRGVDPSTRTAETRNYIPAVIGYAKYYSSKETATSSAGSGSGTVFSGTKFEQLPVSVRSVKISSCYGWRTLTGGPDFHDGVDIGVPTGTPVKAVGPGTVYKTCSGDCGGFGSNIVIKHNNNLYTRYSHLSQIYVREGISVNAGQNIGASGGKPGSYGAGLSTGDHLDFKVYDSETGAKYGGDRGKNPFCYVPFDAAHGVQFVGESCNNVRQRTCST